MRFALLDRITELLPDQSISAIRSLSLSEEYLKDHFPRFPVMPGVMMLEALYQASAWLVRSSEGFASSMVILKEVRSVKFSDFVQPGQTLCVTARIIKQDQDTTTLKAQGTVEGQPAASARLVLQRYNLADQTPGAEPIDQHARGKMREMFDLLYRPASPVEAVC